ncbi:uncharacterized protein LOC135102892 isoform X6 [Scylla paramamosain]|uniref:uncharacterized protein LOC135102892 isoform X6 n=1 Tax=Scylla paramamosain TaxID=85552 RepID=UPI003083E3E5
MSQDVLSHRCHRIGLLSPDLPFFQRVLSSGLLKKRRHGWTTQLMSSSRLKFVFRVAVSRAGQPPGPPPRATVGRAASLGIDLF